MGLRRVGWALVCALPLALGACGPSEEPAAPAPAATPQAAAPAPAASAAPAAPAEAVEVTAASIAKAQEIFSTRCFTCHGAQGAGDGPASAGLAPPPRDFRDPAWQESVTDDHIMKIVAYGGAAVGKSPGMPGNPDLVAQRDVLAALAAHIRSLRASAPQG